jgi:hypothetical protein
LCTCAAKLALYIVAFCAKHLDFDYLLWGISSKIAVSKKKQKKNKKPST